MKNKKILGVGLALVAGLSLASCGGKNKDKNKNDDKGTSDGGSSEQVVTKIFLFNKSFL